MASGKWPLPPLEETRARTFGLLGAVGSFKTSHFGGGPVASATTVHPAGTEPGALMSKRMVSALPKPRVNATIQPTSFILISDVTRKSSTSFYHSGRLVRHITRCETAQPGSMTLERGARVVYFRAA